MATTPFLVARQRQQLGDSYGNRVDRFLAGIAYLDGQRPSLVSARVLRQHDADGMGLGAAGNWTNRWIFDTENQNPDPDAYEGQYAHSLSIADADGDGKDEIIYGVATIDDNGTGLGSAASVTATRARLRYGPRRARASRSSSSTRAPATTAHRRPAVRDAATGQILVQLLVTQNTDLSWPDVGRGVAMDIEPSRGRVLAATTPASTTNAARPAGTAFVNFGVWWDGDLYRERSTARRSPTGTTSAASNIDLDPNSSRSSRPTHPRSTARRTRRTSAATSSATARGRIWRERQHRVLHLHLAIATSTRLTTLMHDSQYRTAIAWQNVAYNQPPHPSFFLGNGMSTPPRRTFITPRARCRAPSALGDADVAHAGEPLVDRGVRRTSHVVKRGTSSGGPL